MRNATSERQASRMRADQEELAHQIARGMPRDGTVEPQPGLHLRRCSRPTERLHWFYEPAFCVIAQGSKELVVQPRGDGSGVKSVDVSPLDANLLDSTLRLVRLIDAPSEYRVLAPLVIREIVYRLLTGAQGSRLRHLATFGGHAHRMVRAVEKLRENFNKPLRIEEIARELGMSVSGLHAHFRAVTAMSPLQFQKAQQLLLLALLFEHL